MIAFPGSRIGAYVLGNRVAQFFGLISYPLYLWHWPLFAFSHIRPGITPDAATMAALSALAVVLAFLTWRYIERPLGHLFRRRPRTVAFALVALLAASGVIGSATRRANGFPGRFPPQVARIFNAGRNGADIPRLSACFYQRDSRRFPLDEERRRVASFFDSHRCGVVADPRKPTIMVVGDSHAAVLFAGLEHEFGARANIIAMTATYCVPLIENTPMDLGMGGTPRCHAINEYVFRQIRAIKPDILVVGAYFVLYTQNRGWIYPGYFNALRASLHGLVEDGVKNVVIAGEVADLVARAADHRRTLCPGRQEAAGILAPGPAAGIARRRRGAPDDGLGAGRDLCLAGGETLPRRRLPPIGRRQAARRNDRDRLRPLQF